MNAKRSATTRTKGLPITDDEQKSGEIKSLVTMLKGQIYLIGKDWDNLLDPEKKEIAEAAVKTVRELSDLVHVAA